MKASNKRDIEYFYECFLQDNLDNSALKRMIEITVKQPYLSRFTASLNVTSPQNYNVGLEVASKFNACKMAIIATNLKQQAFISKLAKMLESHTLELILLKSSALNGYLYTNKRSRGNSDIDLLVNPRDKDKLTVILENIATKYKTQSKPNPFDDLYESTWISKRDPSLYIDVHTALTNPKLFPIPYSDIREQSKQHPFYKSSSIRVMSPEHNLIHASLHIIGDGYLPHHSLIDCAMIAKSEKLDFKELKNRSKEWGCYYSTELILRELNKIIPVTTLNKTHKKSLRLFIARKLLNKYHPPKTIKRRIQQIFIQVTLVDKISRVIATQLWYVSKRLKAVLHRVL